VPNDDGNDLLESKIIIRRRQFKMEMAIQPGMIQYYETLNYTILSQVEGSEVSLKSTKYRTKEKLEVTRTYTHFEWLSEMLA
jgi:hypothetical protein